MKRKPSTYGTGSQFLKEWRHTKIKAWHGECFSSENKQHFLNINIQSYEQSSYFTLDLA